MVVKLRHPVSNKRIVPVRLNRNDAVPSLPSKQLGTVVGLGTTSSNKWKPPNRLKQAALELVGYRQCQSRYDKYSAGRSERINDNSMICAIEPNFVDGSTNKDRPQPESGTACFGDSGGPLLWGERLIGVVSFGPTSCDTSHAPVVFARVSSSYDWIWQQVCELSQNPPSSCRHVHQKKTKHYNDKKLLKLGKLMKKAMTMSKKQKKSNVGRDDDQGNNKKKKVTAKTKKRRERQRSMSKKQRSRRHGME